MQGDREMEMRYPVHPSTVKSMSSDDLYENYHVNSLFTPGELKFVYSHIDRVIIGGVVPTDSPIKLVADAKDLAADFFLERREVGVVNIGGPGTITVDGEAFSLVKQDGLYVGKGKQDVLFASDDAANPAHYYLFSAPSHAPYPTMQIQLADADPVRLGDIQHSNTRTIYKYIHPDGVKSSQIVMGVTLLEPNNMWNTMPAHTHARRMEVYLYFDIPSDAVVFHLMGEPDETRHLVMRDKEAVISPSWSIHAGMGTSNYAFIWAMAGENQAFTDMDAVAMASLR
jgi:4-deoxy-L-threo-5-hexosulose-uronate ketol-isomerase